MFTVMQSLYGKETQKIGTQRNFGGTFADLINCNIAVFVLLLSISVFSIKSYLKKNNSHTAVMIKHNLRKHP